MGLGGRNFIIDEDAFARLGKYLDAYACTLTENRKEVMDEVEMRIADLFRESLSGKDVVTLAMVEKVAERIGLCAAEDAARGQSNPDFNNSYAGNPVHKFYRDTDNRKIGGVCGGIATYFDADATLIRVAALFLLLCCGVGFWFYILCCLVVPSAYTAAQKCELRGIPCTAENLRRFTDTIH